MNLDKIKDFFGNLSQQDLPTAAAVFVGIAMLFFVLKGGKFLMKLLFFLIAAALFAGAYWWHTHK